MVLELQSKTLGALKKIGDDLNVLPGGDRRCRQSWLDAIAGVNPSLLQLLEVSAASVEQVQEPIIETVETSPGVEVEPIQEAPVQSKFGRIVYPRPVQEAIVLAAENSPAASVEQAQEPIAPAAENSPGASVEQAQEPIVPVTENFSGVDVDRVQESIVPVAENSAGVDIVQELAENYAGVDIVQEPIKNCAGVEVDSAKIRNINYLNCPSCGTVRGLYATCPGLESVWETRSIHCDYLEPSIRHPFEDVRPFEVDRAHRSWPKIPPVSKSNPVEDFLPECSNCFGDGYVEDEFGRVKFCQCEPKLSRQKI